MGIDVFSVVIYTSTFLVCTLCFHLSDSSKKWKQLLFGGAAVLILCLLAGFRDDSIGRDIKVYVENYYTAFCGVRSYTQALKLVGFTQLEPFYILLLFVTSRFTRDLWLILFSLQLLTVLPVYLAVLKWRREMHISVGFAMAIYILVFYNNSYNIMRQSISCAFIFLGTTYLLFLRKQKSGFMLKPSGKEYKSAEFFIAVASYFAAYGFHKSALIGIALVVLAFLLKDIPKWMFFAIPAGIIAVLYFLKAAFTIILKHFALPSSFVYYINVFIFQKERTEWMLDHYTNALLFDMLFRTVVCVLPFVLLPKYNKKEYYVRVLTLLGYVGYLIPWLTMKTIYGQRISMYADFFLIASLPYLLTRKIKPGYVVAMVSYVVLTGYWFIWIMIVKWADANVYRFRF